MDKPDQFFVRMRSKHYPSFQSLIGFFLVLMCSSLASQAAAPVVNTEGTWTATQGVAFHYIIVATGTPTSYAVTGLPPGLAVNTSTGVISGIPTKWGTFPLSLSATNGAGTGSAGLTLNVKTDLAKGADVGWLQQMDATGFQFYDTTGKQLDPEQTINCLKILKERNIDLIRLRVFVPPQPSGWNDIVSGNCNVQEVVGVAQKAAALGIRVSIDLECSWSFAQPGGQNIPMPWVTAANQAMANPPAGMTASQAATQALITQLTAHVTDVLTELKAVGVTPEFIQIGNEITDGILLQDNNNYPAAAVNVSYGGSTSNWPQLAKILNAGYDTVKSIDPNIKVVIHIDRAHNDSLDKGFFTNLKNNGGEWDVSGTDCYSGTFSDMSFTMNDLATSFTQVYDPVKNIPGQGGDGVMMCEIEPPGIFDSNGNYNPNPTFDYVTSVLNLMRAVPNGKGVGAIYWEPEAEHDWDAGWPQSAWVNHEPSSALDSFLPGILQASGLNIVGNGGQPIQLKGVNLGGWMVMEPWMTPADSSGLPDEYNILKTLDTRFGVSTEQSLIQTYRKSWITTQDLQNIKAQGLNVIRVPVWWGDFYPLSALGTTNPTLRSDAFTLLDSLITSASELGIYTIIDMHGVFGGQSTSDDTGYANQNQYWTNANDQANTQAMWSAIAAHYNGNAWVAGYDLLNEPSGAPNNQAVVTQLNQLYTAVRAVDPNHIVFMEGTFGNPWGWGSLPNPSTEGWTNVVYEMHEYQYGNQTPSGVEAGAANQVTDFNNHASYNVPDYIGEFNAFGTGTAAWQVVVNDFNNANMSWSSWSYKATHGPAPDSWGLYDPTGTWSTVPNITTDSSSTISSDWSKWTTANTFALNPMISSVLSGGVSITSLPQATAGAGNPFTFQITATGTPTSFSATNLPSGLTLNSTTGLISGTPTDPGDPNHTTIQTVIIGITVNYATTSLTGALLLTIYPPGPVITSNLNVSAQVGVPFTEYISTSTELGGLEEISSPGTQLPPGLTISAPGNGLISGTPTTAGTFTAELAACNQWGVYGPPVLMTFTVKPAATAPVISSAPAASVLVGAPFSYSIVASYSPTSYGATGLPAGLSINTSTGLISGTPTAVGSFAVTISATNSSGTGNATLTLTVTATASAVNTIDLNFSGSADPITGVGVFTGDGLASPKWNNITGTTSTLFTSNGAAATGVGVSFTDSGTYSAATTPSLLSQFLLALSSSTQTVTLTGLTPNGNYLLCLYGQNGSYKSRGATFSITTGSGSPAVGSNAATANVSNSAFVENVNYVVFNVNATSAGTLAIGWTQPPAGGAEGDFNGLQLVPTAGTPAISSAATVTATIGTAFSYTITGSNLPTSYSVFGTLPAGLSCNSATGVISGTPTAVGTSTVTLNAANANGTGTERVTFTVNPPAPVISSATTATGTTGTAFSYTIAASNSPASYGATGIPAGLSINTGTGVISGTPTAAGTYPIALSATNSGGTGTATLSLTINPPAPVISSATTATGTTGTAFSYTIVASNSPASYGATGLPAGLSINTGTGVISGTPSAAGTYPIALSATNSGGTGTATLSLTINPPAPVISSATTAAGTTGAAFSYTIAASNSPTSFNATGLPTGLTVNTSSGLISGTPTAAGTYPIALSATNSGGTGTATLSLTINPPAPVISSATTATGTTGTAFTYTIAASNSPTSFNATGLPTGLTVNTSSGLISGTPSVAGTYPIALSATNSGGTGTATLSLTINPSAPVISSATNATGTTGAAFSYTIAASNSPTSFNATGLPTGLTVNTSSGLISGTPSAAGTYPIALSATNSGGTGTATLSLTINPPAPVISSATTATDAVGSAFSYTITATNSPTSFNATGLPAGLTVNTTTGVITGTPTATGTSTCGLSATNAGGTGTATLTLTVNPPSSTTLVWSGSVSSSWDVSTLNWVNGTTPAAYYNGNTVIFNDSGTAATVAIAGAYSPASVTVTTSANSFTLAGPGTLNGAMTLTKSGTTTLSISGANTYTGGTLLLGGQLNLSGSATALGSGMLTLGSSGDTNTAVVRANSINPANPITINAGGTRWIEPGNGNGVTYTGAVTLNGGATLNLSTVGGNITLSGGVTGTGNILLGENGGARGSSETLSGGAVNMSGTISDAGNPDTGGAYLSAAIGTNVTSITQNSSSEAMTLSGANAFNGPITITTGTLTLAGAGVLGSGAYTGTISNSGTLVFNSTANQTWSGVISGTGSLTDSGTGSLTLSGANTYTGTTTLSAGILLVNGSITGPVSVSSGGTLGGSGKITGSVSAVSGSGLSFNVTSSGVTGLTITGNLTLNGTIQITPNVVSGSITPGTYPIVTYSGTLSGTPTFVWNPPPGTTLTASVNTSTPGVVSLIVNPPPPVINSLATASGPAQSAFSYTITASNSPTSFNATGLPAGLSINTGTGVISGTPSAAGTYPIGLSATNSGGTGSETLTLTVTPPPLSNYQQWLVANGLPATTTDAATPDGDGVPILLKYATAMTPGTPSPAGPATLADPANHLVLQFNRLSPAPVNYLVEASSDLGHWTAIASLAAGASSWTGTATVSESGSNPVAVTVADSVAIGSSAPRFLRLRVTTATDMTLPGTVPAGDTPLNIAASATTATSMTLDNAPVARNTVQAVTSSTITVVSAGTWGNVATPYALRLLSGNASGATFPITAVNGNALTLTTQGVDLTQLVAVGDTYEILPEETLASLFGASGGSFKTGPSASTADVFYLWNGSAWLPYYNNGTSWKQTGTLVSQNNTLLPPGAGWLIARNGTTPLTLYALGRVPEVVVRQFTAPAATSYLAGAYPVSSTLAATGFASASGWLTGTSASTSDVVYLWNGTAWAPYFYNGTHWRQTGSLLSQDAVGLVPGQPIYVSRRSAPALTNAFVVQPLPHTP